jgi:hypothetical protein
MIQYFEEMTLNISENTNFTNTSLNDFESDELFFVQDIEFITSTLSDKAFAHRLIAKDDIIEILLEVVFYSYTSFFDSRYDDHEFKGLLIDSDAARKSIEEIEQFKTLQRIDDVKLNKSNRHIFKFGIENISSVESINLETSLKTITFHIVEANISFLLSLADLDRLRVYFNNLTNELIQDIPQTDLKNRHSVIRRHEHAFLL